MKRIIIAFLMFIPLLGYSQTEEKYFIYNIVSFEGEFTKEDFKVYYDDGKEVKRLRNQDGDKMKFSNTKELQEVLSHLPVRFEILRKAGVING